MYEEEFKDYLTRYTELAERPLKDCISRCKRAEKFLGNLDDAYRIDKLNNIKEKLTYNLDCIPIEGDKKSGINCIKSAVGKYILFCEHRKF